MKLGSFEVATEKPKPTKATKTQGGQTTAFPLTEAQRAAVDQFLKLGQRLDEDAAAVLAEAEKVKETFETKPRGTAIDGCRTFDEFIDRYFPVSSSTVRRLLRKEGKTDKRFANKPKPAAKAAGSTPVEPAEPPVPYDVPQEAANKTVEFVERLNFKKDADKERYSQLVIQYFTNVFNVRRTPIEIADAQAIIPLLPQEAPNEAVL
jgi:hypothetical protein